MPRLLIIDEDVASGRRLQEALEKGGYAVQVAADGANGLLTFRAHRPDLTLLGVRGTEGNGWRVLGRLRKEDPHARVALLGVGPSAEAEARAAEAGCAGYVAKGADPAVFLRRAELLVGSILGGGGDGRFRFFPASEAGEDDASGRVPLRLPAESRGRIVVVDDEPVIRHVLTRFLTGKGFQVFAASNGEEALLLTRKERPHLMLLDLRMPGMDGLAVLKAVREADKELAVMMVTANNDLPTARQTMALGACDYIVKPFDLPYLETTVTAKLLTLRA